MPRKNGQVNEKGVDENHLPDLYCIMQMITQARNRFCERGTCMKVTISDVAKLAGVSTATVSHTINSTRYVSGETKEKVYKAIAELERVLKENGGAMAVKNEVGVGGECEA